MNSAIPPSTTIAPIAMITAELPLNALPPPAVAVVWTVGTAVVVVGVETDGCGKPGVSGFDGACAPDTAGNASAMPATAAAIPARTISTTRRAALNWVSPAYASGCSIAGVSGAST